MTRIGIKLDDINEATNEGLNVDSKEKLCLSIDVKP